MVRGSSDSSAANPRRRWRRWLLRLVVLGVVFVVGWYAVGRATDAGRRVRVMTPDKPMAAPVLAEGEPLVVVAYNIAHGRGLADTNWAGDRDTRLTEIADLLTELSADVVVLNEADLDASWSGRMNQARVLAERAGYAYRVEQANYDLWLPGFRIRFGNAVLSRFPITGAAAIDYPAIRAAEALAFGKKRGVVCTLDLGGGRSVRVAAVHWDTRDMAVRLGSADALAALAGDGGPPIIAAGDFNSLLARPDGQTSAINRLLASSSFAGPADLGAVPGEGPLSFPSDAPARLIDHILAQPPLVVMGFEAVDSTLSDHRPVLAEVRWEAGSAGDAEISP